MTANTIYSQATDVIYAGNTFDFNKADGSTKGIKIAGVLWKATAAQANKGLVPASRLVNVTASSLTVTDASHENAVVTINAAAGCAITLPAATGTGARYEFIIGTTITSNTTTITTGASDYIAGNVYATRQSSGLVTGYVMNGTSNHILTFNGTTQGGVIGDRIILQDVATHLWVCQVWMQTVGASSSPVT